MGTVNSICFNKTMNKAYPILEEQCSRSLRERCQEREGKG